MWPLVWMGDREKWETTQRYQRSSPRALASHHMLLCTAARTFRKLQTGRAIHVRIPSISSRGADRIGNEGCVRRFTLRYRATCSFLQRTDLHIYSFTTAVRSSGSRTLRESGQDSIEARYAGDDMDCSTHIAWQAQRDGVSSISAYFPATAPSCLLALCRKQVRYLQSTTYLLAPGKNNST